MKFTIVEALSSLRPGARWSVSGYDYQGLIWYDDNSTSPPTEEEIAQKIEKLKVEYEATEYKRQRAPEYPDLKEFVDAYYWSQKGDQTKMNEYITKCEQVKNKYPKTP
jgi:uncharacterized coiled-coil DUF342 family protein